MKRLFLVNLCCVSVVCNGQELFSMTEPASNRPARSIGVRVDNSLMDETGTSRINYHLIPEIMVGATQKLMINGAVFFSNRSQALRYEGESLYMKYRFLSHDTVQQHFRMAAFGRLSYNNSDIHQQEINLYGHNTGMEMGVVATKLLQKMAVSTALSFVNASDNGNNNKFIYGKQQQKAINYTFSIGKLLLPHAYSSYHQTNINLMLEVLGQVNTGTGKYYLDIAPSVQMIVNSQARIDISYRKALTADLFRTAPNGFFIRLEYNFFNIF